jgi:NitT/TauT family transport system substrate-binding protein
MSMRKVLILIAIRWLIAITVVHTWLNLHLFNATRAANSRKFRIGFLPVTCHLTCPVTDFI